MFHRLCFADGVLCRLRFEICFVYDTQPFSVKIVSGLLVAADYIPAFRADVNTIIQFEFLMDMPADAAQFAGWKPLVYPDKEAAIFQALAFQDGYELSPAVIRNGLAEFQASFHCGDIQVLDADKVILLRET